MLNAAIQGLVSEDQKKENNMKKLLTLATIAAAVPLIAVESANIVG